MEASERDRRASMEIQANKFAALLLMPPPVLRREIGKTRRPDLRHIVDLAAVFDVSKDAMAHAYAEYHAQPVAIVVARHGRVKRIYRNKHKFPFVAIRFGELLPRSLASKPATTTAGTISDMDECDPEAWIDRPVTHGIEALSEQIMSQRDGYALILLSAETNDCADSDEDADVAERWRTSYHR